MSERKPRSSLQDALEKIGLTEVGTAVRRLFYPALATFSRQENFKIEDAFLRLGYDFLSLIALIQLLDTAIEKGWDAEAQQNLVISFFAVRLLLALGAHNVNKKVLDK